ncbi:MAG: endonuclease [Mariniphaga sp.]|nr:endonuclease [Mariniphaga sp.]
MKTINVWFSVILFFLWHSVFSQPMGYYNGTENLTGGELKKALHEIIKDHVDFSYYRTGQIINYSDSDPANPENVILFYLQESRDASMYGMGGDYINREHVWAKSHGYFSEIRPMDSDVHNLRPADASVNEDRGNKDFDNVRPNGTQHHEATECWFTEWAWEPGPATKGQVARILFYMATRYEDADLEIDLELVDKINTFPLPEHGKLSTLIEWNNQYPPSDFERRRNERIYQIQQNRNPFVDNPEFANLIWNEKSIEKFQFSDLKMIPEKPGVTDIANISLRIASESEPDSVILYWGNSFDSTQSRIPLISGSEKYFNTVSFSNMQAGEIIYFLFKAFSVNDTSVFRGSYIFPENITAEQITPIQNIQGPGTESPFFGQQVIVTGRITANFDNTFYIQDATSERSGICVYNSLKTGKVGDSVVVRGKVTEYSTLTELTDIDYFYNFGNNKIIEPVTISTGQLNEDFEGMLVKLENVTFADGGSRIQSTNSVYSFFDEAGQGVLYSDRNGRLPGKKLPEDRTTIIGIVSQYQGVYQLLAREIADLTMATNATRQHELKQDVSIYPNPASSQLFLNTNLVIKSVVIYSVRGELKLLKTGNIKNIDVSGLQNGMYFLRIQTNLDEFIHKKFLVQ